MRSRNLAEHVKNGIEQNRRDTFVGKVTKVYGKESDDIEEGNIEVNAMTRSRSDELRRIPVLQFDHDGHVCVPQTGDYVLVEYLAGKGETLYVTGIIYTDETRSPLAREGHWRHEFGGPNDSEKLYLEAEKSGSQAGNPDVVRMGIKTDGLSEPSTEIAVDNSGSDTKISIDTDADIQISANGDIHIDTGGQALYNGSEIATQ